MRLFILFSVVSAFLAATAMRSEDPAPPVLLVPLHIIELDRSNGVLILQPAVEAAKCTDIGAEYLACEDVTYSAVFVPHPESHEKGSEMLRAAR